jgi:phosphoribosylformylglycinamidine (FGAM) synthase-like enzyme
MCPTPAAMFSEEPSRIVASVARANLAELKSRAAKAGVPLAELGTTASEGFVLSLGQSELVRATLSELRDAREHCLTAIVGD